jgi:hypothetical protein
MTVAKVIVCINWRKIGEKENIKARMSGRTLLVIAKIQLQIAEIHIQKIHSNYHERTNQ